jgi:hypothetical protein
MTNYDSKYLKYKNKYINLKNEYYGSGNKDIIVLYDDTNTAVNNLFQTIKEGYTNHYNTKDNIKEKYYIDDSINLRKELNCLLNIYTYILGDNKIESEFRFNFSNLQHLIKNGSRRMQPLVIPFKKAIKQYSKASKIELKDDYSRYIITNYNCDSLALQLNQLMEHINTNDNLNNASRITSTKALLELVKLYQTKGEVDDVKYQSTRIGQFVTLSKNDNIIVPAGVTADIQIIGEEIKQEQSENSEEKTEKTEKEVKKNVQKEIELNKDKEREKEIKLKEYLREGRTELILNLNISNFKFNKLNNMIHLRMSNDKVKMKRTNPLIEVINIFNK